ncbi:glycosyl transferase family 2 [Anaeromyxobacter sp. Fw109-5]|nr:glycosyl transferase family 2 [Anaeromyxobacter sp. Fw109-5]
MRRSGGALKVSVVTPSFNQGAYIERTIESVLAQRGEFELEYLVVDGGSTDETVSILRRYEGRLRFVSEPDRGQSDAINKGFRATTGDIVAWLNSDDTYAPGALDAVVTTLARTGARWCFGECPIIDERDAEVRSAIARYKAWVARRYSLRRLVGRNFIPQPATFFRRDLIDEVGPIDESLHYAMDYDLWLRFARVAEPVFVPRPLARFRWHGASKTGAGYSEGAWECFRIARARARGVERFALAEHLAHLAAQLAVYRLLDAGRR